MSILAGSTRKSPCSPLIFAALLCSNAVGAHASDLIDLGAPVSSFKYARVPWEITSTWECEGTSLDAQKRLQEFGVSTEKDKIMIDFSKDSWTLTIPDNTSANRNYEFHSQIISRYRGYSGLGDVLVITYQPTAFTAWQWTLPENKIAVLNGAILGMPSISVFDCTPR